MNLPHLLGESNHSCSLRSSSCSRTWKILQDLMFFKTWESQTMTENKLKEMWKYQEIQTKNIEIFRRERKDTHKYYDALKNVIIVGKCSPSDKLSIINAIKRNNVYCIYKYADHQYVCRYYMIVKNLRMDMSNCSNARNKVSHPLQCVAMKNATGTYKHSWTVDLAANVTNQAAHRLWQSGWN